MEALRKCDPSFTNFVPKTAAEAVDRFQRCKRNGLKPFLVPECLIRCAVGLEGEELDMFETWMINPNGDQSGDLVDLVEMRKRENEEFQRRAQKIEMDLSQATIEALPEVPEVPEAPESPAPTASSAE